MNISQSNISCGIKEITGVNQFRKKVSKYDMMYLGTNLDGTRFRKKIREYIRREIGRRGQLGDGGGSKLKGARIGFVFSDRAAAGRGGPALVEYIREKKLGEVVETSEYVNYNTGNKIKCWFFTPSEEFMKSAIGE